MDYKSILMERDFEKLSDPASDSYLVIYKQLIIFLMRYFICSKNPNPIRVDRCSIH